MTAMYQVAANEADAFIAMFKTTFANRAVRVTVEPLSPEEETRERMLRAVNAEKRGDFVHTMSIDELEALVHPHSPPRRTYSEAPAARAFSFRAR